jgi:hypothetical protein
MALYSNHQKRVSQNVALFVYVYLLGAIVFLCYLRSYVNDRHVVCKETIRAGMVSNYGT